MKKFFITGGFGNNIFQKIWLENHKNVKRISLLERTSFINNFITKFSTHSDIIGFNDHALTPSFIDYFILMILFVKKKISNKDFVSILIFKNEWHFGYYQHNFLLNEAAVRVYREISNDINLELRSVDGDYGVIHIRRGDFENDGRVLIFDYYIKAIISLIDLNKLPKKMVIIGPITEAEINQLTVSFSCDFITQGGSELDALRLLHNASVAIGSNSTFAFWPICFGKSKIAIFPKELKKNIKSLQDCKTQGSLFVI